MSNEDPEIEHSKHSIVTEKEERDRERNKYLHKKERNQVYTIICSCLSTGLEVISLFLLLQYKQVTLVGAVFLIAYGISFLLWAFFRAYTHSLEERFQNLCFEIDLLRLEANQAEVRAEKILQLNSAQIRQYHNLNL